METLYRKVQILNIVDRCFHMYASDYRNDARIYATEMLEEIPDNLHQIEKMEADKAELLDYLQDEINEFSVLGYEPSKYQLGYNSAINDIMEILKPTPKI